MISVAVEAPCSSGTVGGNWRGRVANVGWDCVRAGLAGDMLGDVLVGRWNEGRVRFVGDVMVGDVGDVEGIGGRA